MNPTRRLWLITALALLSLISLRAETFRIAEYNVENYLDHPTETRRFVKSEAAKAKIRESIHALNPDVICFEEMGSTNALLELRASLMVEDLDFPYWEHVSGFDTNIHVAVLSKFPITARRSHTNENFLLDGRRFSVSRGFVEVDIQVTTNYSFTLLGAHLKSKRPVPEADEAELRLQEAKLLREKVDAILKAKPNANLVVLGDFNNTKDSPSTKTIIGTGKLKLVDTRPAERNGDDAPNPNPRYSPMNVTWTYYYGTEDSYSRIDYILLSPGMAREWIKKETYVLALPNWGIGSDHRPIVATFEAADK
ncbi:MAG TPA: endonuclease/exonuclease/phosphatase family protein [Verrucomicrobiae bacterium]|nr:endonuclease/exonuclease/phosphatase family protein [Verrucomicrobiae bacterium]